ncbi:unnamed protein product [Umbelopsis ramanniana]
MSLTVREYDFASNLPPLAIHEDPTGQWSLGVAGTIWDSSYVLARYLEKSLVQQPITNQSNILELGAGLGIVGMSLARFLPSANIVLTDKSDRLKLLQHNVQSNNSTATVTGYDWETPTAAIEEQNWDMILVSDCIWEPSLHTILLQALHRVMKSTTVLLMAYEVRNEPVEEQFLDSLRHSYTLQTIPTEEMDEQFQSDDIRIVRAQFACTTRFV